MSSPRALYRHQWVKVEGAFTQVTFDKYARFFKIKNCQIPWIKLSPTHYDIIFRYDRSSTMLDLIKKPIKLDFLKRSSLTTN